MAIGTHTPRDKFDLLIAFVRRTMRYWWLIGIITFVGGALAVVFALKQKPKYLSEAKIFYNERIQSSVLQGRDFGVNTKNLGFQFQEMLLSRTNVVKIIEGLDLHAKTRAKQGLDAGIEEFRKEAAFKVRGTGMFHISYLSEDADLSQKVASMMVDTLLAEDERVRREQASATMNFLLEQKAKINKELDKRQRELATFLSEHPEFALDTAAGGAAATPGASIRGAQAKGGSPSALPPLPDNIDPRLNALERQRRRIRDRLATPDTQGGSTPRKTPEQLEAERLVEEADRELRRAKRELEDRLSRLQPAHPDVIRAQSEAAAAQQRLDRAKTQVPPAPPKAEPVNREALQEELAQIEREITNTKNRVRREQGEDVVIEDEDTTTEIGQEENWVVALETEFARRHQAVEEQRKRLESTDSSLSRAEISASQQMAEQGAVLTIIDPPNRPTMPQGKGRAILAAAGTAVFVMLGTLLALALALIDDRIYGAGDLERLAIAPVAVVVPRQRKAGLLRRLFRRG
jgi:capsular polysaccharide biosynthesis protein